MSDTSPQSPQSPRPASSSAMAKTSESDSALVTQQGKTTIADTVVSKIAGIATREVSGVHALGGGASGVVGQLRERIPGASTNHSQGVSVDRKSTRLNSSHLRLSRMPSSA